MAGHSKWANIKHRKSRMDAQKGKIFTRLAREIMVTARDGADIQSNVRLRLAVQKARDANMPGENIQKAIQKGSGAVEGESYESVIYEGYGPGGVAILVEATTDNRNRTAPEIRNLFSRNGGSLGEAGCVSWMFERKGLLVFEDGTAIEEDELMNEALEAGAEDVKAEDNTYEIITAPEDFEAVREAFTEKKITFSSAQVTMIPGSVVNVDDPETAAALLKLMDALEDHDDVQNAYANFDIPDELIK